MKKHLKVTEVSDADDGPFHVPLHPMIPVSEIYDLRSFAVYIVTDSEVVTAISVDLEQAEQMADFFTHHAGHEFHVMCRSATLGPPGSPTVSGPTFDEEFNLFDDNEDDEVPF